MATPRPERESYAGLSQVAHAIRRSTALNVASAIVPPDSSVDDLLEMAERLATWIGGKALAQEQDGLPAGGPLGQAWPPVD